ncbi:response regulator [Actinopolymorpha singaporensis]|nr:response regulator transcription factor [Actinopolymorpha singaporensis]
MTIRVFVVDDHEVVRGGIRELLHDEPDIEVVGEAGTAAQARARVPALRPHVAILDVRLPDGNGVEVCREIRAATEPPPACLMLTSYSDDQALFDAIMAGAAGYLLKQIDSNAILAAIRHVAAGGSMLDPALTAAVLDRLRKPPPEDPRYATLTEKEREILELVADGLTNKQIAKDLFLAEKTVKNYVSAILRKLGMERRTEAAVFAVELRRNAGHDR